MVVMKMQNDSEGYKSLSNLTASWIQWLDYLTNLLNDLICFIVAEDPVDDG